MASFIENTKSTYLFGLLTLFVSVYGPRLSPKLPEPVQKAFTHPAFRAVMMFLVVFLAKHDIKTAIVVTVIFLILSHLLHQETLTETFLQKYEKNIEQFADSNLPTRSPDIINGTICAPIQRRQNSIKGQDNIAYYDPLCYPKPQYDPTSDQILALCESKDKCDPEYCWQPAIQEDDTTHYDNNRYAVPNDSDHSRKFACTQPDPNDTTNLCQAVQPIKVIPTVCRLENSKYVMSDSSGDIDNANCSYSLQCNPILKTDGSLAGNDDFNSCGDINQNPICIKNNTGDDMQGKCVYIDCAADKHGKFDYSSYKKFVGDMGLKTATEQEYHDYCQQVTSPNAQTDLTRDLGNSVLNSASQEANFKSKKYKPGIISSSTFPDLFINRNSTDKQFSSTPQRWQANRYLYTTAGDHEKEGMGCWKQVYDLGQQEQVERNIAAPTTDNLIYNPQSGDYDTGFGIMTDSKKQSLDAFN